MSRLKQKYIKEVIPAMKEKFGYKNDLAVPRLERAILNVGLGPALKDSKFMDTVENTLLKITGQKPIKTLAKKSVSSFKIRKGMVVGMKVTLRGERMNDFVDKLINIALPRVRDFRGLSPQIMDGRGNLAIGFKEHIVFPEIKPDEVEKLHGLEVVVVTTATDDREGLELLKLLGFPFREK
ncbi:MAG: 50S ribosomal protein L5 [Parcubacteria group bacterium CG_4_10_14_0_8_um_filter_35_7]|nr:MAG: 50S ribosomal protein L5 [Parcubacteria group bacterium CG23_combo_of_CG06-09_8_20_14_all_35_9]PIY78757.1 MAG: 50S ribosomal protein L5 [Parcubacteria group bacterium CG_4_10_14_0_8_um_filter_35_7]